MTLLARFLGLAASILSGGARLTPKLVSLAVISMIGLSAGQSAPDCDHDSDEAAHSVAYRHFL